MAHNCLVDTYEFSFSRPYAPISTIHSEIDAEYRADHGVSMFILIGNLRMIEKKREN